MKKLDYLLIVIIVLIIGFFTVQYFNKFFIDTSDAKVIITYKNLRLDLVDYEESLDIIYEIEIKEEKPEELILIKNNQGIVTRKTFVIPKDEKIYNRLHLIYQNIHVEEASCLNKVCMRTKMSSKETLPIVCTNGVVIEFMSYQEYIDEVLVP